jgi:hypothetical protein
VLSKFHSLPYNLPNTLSISNAWNNLLYKQNTCHNYTAKLLPSKALSKFLPSPYDHSIHLFGYYMYAIHWRWGSRWKKIRPPFFFTLRPKVCHQKCCPNSSYRHISIHCVYMRYICIIFEQNAPFQCEALFVLVLTLLGNTLLCYISQVWNSFPGASEAFR